jgi:hypothetical protein
MNDDGGLGRRHGLASSIYSGGGHFTALHFSLVRFETFTRHFMPTSNFKRLKLLAVLPIENNFFQRNTFTATAASKSRGPWLCNAVALMDRKKLSLLFSEDFFLILNESLTTTK